jgi:hypothetical protein
VELLPIGPKSEEEMFKDRVLAVRSWMALGKLLILLVISPSVWSYENPRFFEYRSDTPVGQILEFSFGWFKTLNDRQKESYYQSVAHAVMYAENGQKVTWYKEDASGFAVPVVTWPTGSGYCRRVYIEVIAYGMIKHKRLNACYDNTSSKWNWAPDK